MNAPTYNIITNEDMNIAGVIVAKKDSKRLPGKTFIELGGQSLLQRKINAIQQTNLVNRVVIGTNSQHVEKVGLENGCEVLWREEYYCDEARCSANEMIHDMVSRIDADIIVWLHLTNPLVSSTTIDKAVSTFLELQEEDSLCSVERVNEHFWFDDKPLNFNPWGKRHPLAGELKPYFKQNGAIFIQSRADMVRNSYFYGNNPFLFEMDMFESVDINTPSDYLTAQAYYTYLSESKTQSPIYPRKGSDLRMNVGRPKELSLR